jgi:hypothetical protein
MASQLSNVIVDFCQRGVIPRAIQAAADLNQLQALLQIALTKAVL